MGKISIKHFLNTNLKPYIINKQNYYSIYVLITAQRKTTKVKSITFNEYYTESDFNDIFSSESNDDKIMIENETHAINIISELVINELQEFDTNFLTAFYNFSNTVDIWKIDNQIFTYNNVQIDLFDSKKNSAGISIDNIKLIFTKARGLTLFEFYNKQNQEKAKNELQKQSVKNIEDALNDINKSFFYRSMEFFEWYVEGNKKNAELKERYSIFFETYDTLINSHLVEKYKII